MPPGSSRTVFSASDGPDSTISHWVSTARTLRRRPVAVMTHLTHPSGRFRARRALAGVGIRPRIATGRADDQPVEVLLPSLLVMCALPVVRQPLVPQHDAGAAVLLCQCHDDGRA